VTSIGGAREGVAVFISKGTQTMETKDRILRHGIRLHDNYPPGCAICGDSADGPLVSFTHPGPEPKPRWSVHERCFEAELAKQNGKAACRAIGRRRSYQQKDQ